jgi:hypothetical protein
MPPNDSTPSFERDIKPLFRPIDIEHMEPMGVLLADYAYMSDERSAQSVYDFLTGTQQPQMPIGGPYWSDDQLKTYADWMTGGRKP